MGVQNNSIYPIFCDDSSLLFGAILKLLTGSPSAIRWETDTSGNAAAFGRGSTRGHPYRLAVIRAAPGSTPRGPSPPAYRLA